MKPIAYPNPDNVDWGLYYTKTSPWYTISISHPVQTTFNITTMRKTIFTTVFLLCFSSFLFAQVEEVANEVLKGYKTRDVQLLKKHASGIMQMAISDSYFEDKDVQKDLKAIDNWDGKIRDIRYNSDNMMGKTIYLAMAYFSDVQGNDNEIYTVALSSTDKEKWVMFANGIAIETRENFEKMQTILPSKSTKSIASNANTKHADFAIELASGDTYKGVSEKLIDECINKLDDDNFYIILSHNDDYIQAAFSDNTFSVEYNDKNGHFTSVEFLSKDKTTHLFKQYLNQAENWNKDISWEQ